MDEEKQEQSEETNKVEEAKIEADAVDVQVIEDGHKVEEEQRQMTWTGRSNMEEVCNADMVGEAKLVESHLV